MKNIAVCILAVLLIRNCFAQDTATITFYEQMKSYDLSAILTADSILTEDHEGGKNKIERPEIIGFIGDNYQRLQIHFISIIQNQENP